MANLYFQVLLKSSVNRICKNNVDCLKFFRLLHNLAQKISFPVGTANILNSVLLPDLFIDFFKTMEHRAHFVSPKFFAKFTHITSLIMTTSWDPCWWLIRGSICEQVHRQIRRLLNVTNWRHVDRFVVIVKLKLSTLRVYMRRDSKKQRRPLSLCVMNADCAKATNSAIKSLALADSAVFWLIKKNSPILLAILLNLD